MWIVVAVLDRATLNSPRDVLAFTGISGITPNIFRVLSMFTARFLWVSLRFSPPCDILSLPGAELPADPPPPGYNELTLFNIPPGTVDLIAASHTPQALSLHATWLQPTLFSATCGFQKMTNRKSNLFASE